MDIILVIGRLRPTSAYHFTGKGDGEDGYEAIGKWRDPLTTKPTEAECLAEWEVVLQERAAQAVIDEEYRFIVAAAKQQKVELLSLPNWATWTYLEAETEVSKLITNGITQAQAEAAIDSIRTGNVNQAITDLKPILKNMVRAIYAVDTILKAMAKCIVFMRDILKP